MSILEMRINQNVYKMCGLKQCEFTQFNHLNCCPAVKTCPKHIHIPYKSAATGWSTFVCPLRLSAYSCTKSLCFSSLKGNYASKCDMRIHKGCQIGITQKQSCCLFKCTAIQRSLSFAAAVRKRTFSVSERILLQLHFFSNKNAV